MLQGRWEYGTWVSGQLPALLLMMHMSQLKLPTLMVLLPQLRCKPPSQLNLPAETAWQTPSLADDQG